jgi:hypothetical protein
MLYSNSKASERCLDGGSPIAVTVTVAQRYGDGVTLVLSIHCKYSCDVCCVVFVLLQIRRCFPCVGLGLGWSVSDA